MAALMVSQVKVLNAEKFQQYLAQSKDVAARYGAELAIRSRFSEALLRETSPHDLLIIARFPDTNAIHGWYNDPAYKDIVALREEASTQTLSIYEEL